MVEKGRFHEEQVDAARDLYQSFVGPVSPEYTMAPPPGTFSSTRMA